MTTFNKTGHSRHRKYNVWISSLFIGKSLILDDKLHGSAAHIMINTCRCSESSPSEQPVRDEVLVQWFQQLGSHDIIYHKDTLAAFVFFMLKVCGAVYQSLMLICGQHHRFRFRFTTHLLLHDPIHLHNHYHKAES